MPDVRDTLVPIRPSGARTPLYCVHPISGSAYSYGGLVRLLDPEVPVHAFEAPGFDDDQPPATVLEELSTSYVEALRDADAKGPYCLLGWSMGGVIAFDMALRLAAVGAQVSALVLVDAAAPARTQMPSPIEQVRKFMHDMVAAAQIPEAGLSEVFERADSGSSPITLLERIEAAGILPEELDLDFLCSRFGIFQAHLRALFHYTAPCVYDGPVTVIRAEQSPEQYSDWHTVASHIETHVVAGDHHSIWTGERLTALARVVQRRLDATLTGVP